MIRGNLRLTVLFVAALNVFHVIHGYSEGMGKACDHVKGADQVQYSVPSAIDAFRLSFFIVSCYA